jgi:hypothetical protein
VLGTAKILSIRNNAGDQENYDTPWWKNAVAEAQDVASPPITASLTSSLSKAGGMHRELSVSLTVSSSNTAQDTKPWEATFFVLLVVSESWFIDVDDPFVGDCSAGKEESSSSSCHVDWIYPSIIDIEAPATNAIPHFVPLKVSVRSHVSSTDIQFGINIHTRYPYLSETGQQTLTLLEPLLLGGYYRVGRVGVGGGDDREEEQELENYYPSWPSDTIRAHTTTIGAGRPQDYEFVMVVTVLASFIGLIIGLRDIASISRWDYV